MAVAAAVSVYRCLCMCVRACVACLVLRVCAFVGCGVPAIHSPLFVTWKKYDSRRKHLNLRGCIGNLGPIPLTKIKEYALTRYVCTHACMHASMHTRRRACAVSCHALRRLPCCTGAACVYVYEHMPACRSPLECARRALHTATCTATQHTHAHRTPLPPTISACGGWVVVGGTAVHCGTADLTRWTRASCVTHTAVCHCL